jgi:hypothetical protein
MAEDTIIPLPHVEAAKAVLEELRALRAKIPRFVIEVPNETQKIANVASVPDPFVESAGFAADASKQLEAAAGADPATLRDSFGFALAFDSVIVEAYAFARAVEHTVRVQRATAGASALDIYAVAQRLAKGKNGAQFVPHVEDMRRKLKRRSGRKRKTTSEPAPVPAATSAPKSVV